QYRELALGMGFLEVVSGPLVRSSYRAEQVLERNNVGLDPAVIEVIRETAALRCCSSIAIPKARPWQAGPATHPHPHRQATVPPHENWRCPGACAAPRRRLSG